MSDPKGIIVVTPEPIQPASVTTHKSQKVEPAVGRAVIIGEKKPEVKEAEAPKEEPKKQAEVPEKKVEPGEGIEEKLTRLRDSMGYVVRKPKMKAAVVDDSTAKKEEPKVEKEPTKEPEKKAEPEVKPKPAPRQDVRDIVEAATSAATTAAIEATRTKPAVKDREPEVDLSEADQRDYTVLQRLEKDNPKRYKGVAKQFVKYVDELSKYQSDWTKEHPGEDFDPDSKDHAGFYEQHEPKYEAEDFEDAKFNIKADDLKKKWEDESSQKYGKLEERLTLFELAPKVEKSKADAVKSFVEGVDKGFQKTMAEKGPDALREEDPIAFEVMDRIARGLTAVVQEIEQLSHPSGKFQIDPKNTVHQQLNDFANTTQNYIKSLPYEDQLKDGKVFATQAEFNGMPEAQRQRYWTLSYDMLKEAVVLDATETAKKVIEGEREKFNKYAKSRGLSASNTPPEKKPAQAAKATEPEPVKHKSPAAQTEQVSPPRPGFEKQEPGPAVQSLLNTMFPK